ncbi:MAG TPA: hypothetical protein VIL97_09895, partial [Thermoanaerobaculia bacterium]
MRGRPSATAILIARSLLLWSHNRHVAPLIPRGAAEISRDLLLAAGDDRTVSRLERPLHRSLARS